MTTGNNYFTPFAANVTPFTAAALNAPLILHDKVLSYATKSIIVHCDGNITWAAGVLTWSGTIRILFNREDGQAIQNTISATNISLADNEFCYVDLSETNDTALTMQKAAITTGSASNFLTVARVVMAYRNTASHELYAAWLPIKYSIIDPTRYLDGRVQPITPGASVTIDWSLGETATLLLDRATTEITFSNPKRVMRLKLLSDATPGRAVTWADTIHWRDSDTTPPAITALANAWDWVTIIWDGTAYSADTALNFT